MKNVRSKPGTGSLDMLLDTMCNTFGGVCFIALMVAILSALMPAGKETDGTETVTEQMLVDQEIERLVRRRDELKAAVQIQRSFVDTNASQMVAVNEAMLRSGVASNVAALASLKSERRDLEDALATLTTESEYSRREAARLERVLKDLEARLDRPVGRQRAVRTPMERELSGMRCENFWLRRGRLYLLKNDWQVKSSDVTRGDDGKGHWNCTPIPGKGYVVDESFFFGSDWKEIKRKLNAEGYVRIFSDKMSFPQLCKLRDALVHFKKQYNWHVWETDVLSFVEGYDGRIQ